VKKCTSKKKPKRWNRMKHNQPKKMTVCEDASCSWWNLLLLMKGPPWWSQPP
jgi:hypothetical protein